MPKARSGPEKPARLQAAMLSQQRRPLQLPLPADAGRHVDQWQILNHRLPANRWILSSRLMDAFPSKLG